ncbi:hypothetical protein B566_EDAN007599 [Ephemera danica]|nr:hypothetical protein B566_EDAN007599 [Ephemera danica]
MVPSDELRHCNAQFEASQRYQGHIDAQPQQTPSAVLEHIRSALLRHRWNDVAKLLPYFFHFWDFKPFIWKTALQVVCHHPESSEIEMMNLIRTCLQVSVVPDDYLRKIFCVQSFEDSVPIPFKGKKVNHKKGAKKHSRKSHK